jgi:DNA-binding transcriptional regulator PaaX
MQRASRSRDLQRQCVTSLLRKKYITRNSKNPHVLSLTPRGKSKLLHMRIQQRSHTWHSEQIQKWDGTWTVCTYDIPEEHRPTRDALRYQLKTFGWFQLQKNMWIYPFSSTDMVEILQEDPVARAHMVVWSGRIQLGSNAKACAFFKLPHTKTSDALSSDTH